MNQLKKPADQRISEAAAGIEKVLARGFRPGKNTLYFIESTYGVSSAEEICQLFSPAHSEAESLLDMMMFPDEPLQTELEPLFEKVRLQNEAEIKDLAENLALKRPGTRIFLEGDPSGFKVVIPEPVLFRFVTRLRADHNTDHGIIQVIDTTVKAPGMATFLKVKLRNSRFPFTEDRRLSILRFLDHLSEKTPDFGEMFSYLCRVLESIDEGEDLCTALAERRQKAFDLIRLAEKNQEDLQQMPMEALMMRGTRICAVNLEEIHVEIGYIDRLLFELSEPPIS